MMLLIVFCCPIYKRPKPLSNVLYVGLILSKQNDIFQILIYLFQHSGNLNSTEIYDFANPFKFTISMTSVGASKG